MLAVNRFAVLSHIPNRHKGTARKDGPGLDTLDGHCRTEQVVSLQARFLQEDVAQGTDESRGNEQVVSPPQFTDVTFPTNDTRSKHFMGSFS